MFEIDYGLKDLENYSGDESSYISSNGLRFAYGTFGNKSNPAIILVAGLYNQMVRWPIEFCHDLAARNFFVIRFDNRDIGLSNWMTGLKAPSLVRQMLKYRFGLPVDVPYTLDDMAADTVGILDGLSVKKAHFVGMSMGGMICQIAAARYPDRALSLTSIMSTSGTFGKGKPSLKASMQMLKKPSKGQSRIDNSVEILQFLGSPGYPVSDSVVRAMVELEYARGSNPAGYLRQMAAINTAPNRVHLLNSLKIPALIIHGREDLLVPLSGGIDTARHIRNSRLVVFPGMGHNLPIQLLGRFADLIAEHQTS